MDWFNKAKCRKTSEVDFFSTSLIEVRAAKEFCQTCPVKNMCLLHALSNNMSYGVWGGKTPRERRRIILSQANPNL